jgi:hypothetical protein
MNPSLDIEIRDKLIFYLLGEISLEDFKGWFVPILWDVDHSNNQTAINMAYEIELRLAEYSDGYWNEDELKQFFRPLIENYSINIVPMKIGSNARVDQWLISVPSYILSSGASL